MPTKKNRGTEGRNFPTPSLREAMGIGGQHIGTPHNPHDYLKDNIKQSNTKSSGSSPKSWNDGYDVKTKVSIGSAKAMGTNARTMRKMKAT